MFKNLSRTQELDTVLKRISLARHGYTHFEEIESDLSRLDKLMLDPDFLQAIIVKLLNDKYISKDNQLLEGKSVNGVKLKDIKTPVYFITWNGLYLLEMGGYYQLEMNRLSENTRLENIERHQKNHRRYMTWLTVILAVVGVIAAFYPAIEVYKFFYR